MSFPYLGPTLGIRAATLKLSQSLTGSQDRPKQKRSHHKKPRCYKRLSGTKNMANAATWAWTHCLLMQTPSPQSSLEAWDHDDPPRLAFSSQFGLGACSRIGENKSHPDPAIGRVDDAELQRWAERGALAELRAEHGAMGWWLIDFRFSLRLLYSLPADSLVLERHIRLALVVLGPSREPHTRPRGSNCGLVFPCH